MTKSPIDALDNFYGIVRERAIADPKFAEALCRAIGAQIEFRGADAVAAVDPVLEARHGAEKFRETFLSFSAKDLKKMLKDFALASPQDMKGKTKPAQLVDLLWERSAQKLKDLTPS